VPPQPLLAPVQKEEVNRGQCWGSPTVWPGQWPGWLPPSTSFSPPLSVSNLGFSSLDRIKSSLWHKVFSSLLTLALAPCSPEGIWPHQGAHPVDFARSPTCSFSLSLHPGAGSPHHTRGFCSSDFVTSLQTLVLGQLSVFSKSAARDTKDQLSDLGFPVPGLTSPSSPPATSRSLVPSPPLSQRKPRSQREHLWSSLH
jgi:hypothetical protein